MLFTILSSSGLTPLDAVMLFIFTIFIFIFSLTLHELAHGYVAYKMGDLTPKLAGRLTFNPIKHVSTVGFLSFLIIGVGWAKPMPTNPLNYKKFRTGSRLVAIAGVLVNLLIALISAGIHAILFVTVGYGVNLALDYLLMFFDFACLINCCLFMFNILPLFPLDGFEFIASFLKIDSKFVKFNMKYGTSILYGIFLVSILIELITGIDLFGYYISILYRFVFAPLAYI